MQQNLREGKLSERRTDFSRCKLDLNLNSFFSGLNLLLGICTFILTATVKRTFQPFWDKPVGNRLLPLVPLVFGLVLAFAGLHEETITRWQEKFAIGLVASFAASYIFKFSQTTLLGWDDKSQKAKIDRRKRAEPKP
jgi:hypothetical protein